MTVEERAKELARLIVFGNGLVSSAIELAKQAIIAAIEEEREAHAKIVEENRFKEPGEVADIIRARSTPQSS